MHLRHLQRVRVDHGVELRVLPHALDTLTLGALLAVAARQQRVALRLATRRHIARHGRTTRRCHRARLSTTLRAWRLGSPDSSTVRFHLLPCVGDPCVPRSELRIVNRKPLPISLDGAQRVGHLLQIGVNVPHRGEQCMLALLAPLALPPRALSLGAYERRTHVLPHFLKRVRHHAGAASADADPREKKLCELPLRSTSPLKRS
mmetsp:Transcript_2368/g.4985  ORF Transcript_2368/g.4985 Transcript_2368/m.4985 type:complete len:204 (-) Transcript_2368:230-841(-)